MKKTLVALAVLAASGASFAQVSITGYVASGFTQTTSDASGDKSGLGVDTADVYISSTEDLGNGTSVNASLALIDLGRGLAVDASDATTASGAAGAGDVNLGITTSSVNFNLSHAKATDYLSANGEGSVSAKNGTMLDNTYNAFFQDRVTRDGATIGTNFGPVAVSFSMQDADAGWTGTGRSGAAYNTVAQRRNVLSATYTAGALAINGGYAIYDNRVTNSNTTNKDITRASVSYDFGAVAVGGGASILTQDGDGKIEDMLVSFNVPMGAFAFGGSYATSKASGSAQGKWAGSTLTIANGTRNAYSVQGTYALSKRTSVIANYTSYDAASTTATQNKNTRTDVLLATSF